MSHNGLSGESMSDFIARYVHPDLVPSYIKAGWNVMQFAGHHGRFYLAWRDE